MVGLPLSGKTTLAKALEEELGFARVNIDEIKFKKGNEEVGDDVLIRYGARFLRNLVSG